MSGVVAVIGGGVAGCAAAAAASRAGAACVLLESSQVLGGVAVQGEHLTLCGLAALDGAQPELLEAQLLGDWLERLTSGAPYRQGRVWLWPTRSGILSAGLAAGLTAAGVAVQRGTRVVGLDHADGVIQALRISDLHAPRAARVLPCRQVIDASGSGLVAGFLGLACQPASQWASVRAQLRLGPAPHPLHRAARVRLLGRMQQALGVTSALALVAMDDGTWQLSMDVPPGSARPDVEPLLSRAAQAIGAEILSVTQAIAQRDAGRPVGALTLEELFSQTQRGLCWASWPREEHTAQGVAWTYPTTPRYGVPRQAVMLPGTPEGCWFVGKGMPVTTAAAAALRVTGTALALGAAVGRLAAAEMASSVG